MANPIYDRMRSINYLLEVLAAFFSVIALNTKDTSAWILQLLEFTLLAMQLLMKAFFLMCMILLQLTHYTCFYLLILKISLCKFWTVPSSLLLHRYLLFLLPYLSRVSLVYMMTRHMSNHHHSLRQLCHHRHLCHQFKRCLIRHLRHRSFFNNLLHHSLRQFRGIL